MRKKSSQISTLEQELDSKVSMITENVARVADLETEIEGHRGESAGLRRELEEITKREKMEGNRVQQMTRLHQEHCVEMEIQIEKVRSSSFNRDIYCLKLLKITEILKQTKPCTKLCNSYSRYFQLQQRLAESDGLQNERDRYISELKNELEGKDSMIKETQRVSEHS